MLVLIGLLPANYALNLKESAGAREAQSAARRVEVVLTSHPLPVASDTLQQLETLIGELEGKASLREVPLDERWRVRSMIFQLERQLESQRSSGPGPANLVLEGPREELRQAIEYVPTWVIVGVALCLGIGTTIGYKRIVITVAEKIGKTHLTYAQGACAEMVAMATIGLADIGGLPVSTTHVLSSGVAGTMWANKSGIQMATLRSIAIAWALTLPAATLLSAGLYLFGATWQLDSDQLAPCSGASLVTACVFVPRTPGPESHQAGSASHGLSAPSEPHVRLEFSSGTTLEMRS